MNEFFKNIILFFVGDNAFVGTMFASMLPIIEARGSIPLGSTDAIFSSPLSLPLSFLSAFIGSTLMTLILLPIVIPFFKYLKKFEWFSSIYNKVANKINNHEKKLAKKKSEIRKYIYLGALCALPVPLTGYYTSCLIAGLCNMKFLPSFISIVIGNIICMLIVILFALLIPEISIWIFYIFAIAFIITILIILVQFLISVFINKKNNIKKKN